MPAWTFSGEFLDGAERDHVVIGTGAAEQLPGRFALAGLLLAGTDVGEYAWPDRLASLT